MKLSPPKRNQDAQTSFTVWGRKGEEGDEPSSHVDALQNKDEKNCQYMHLSQITTKERRTEAPSASALTNPL